MTLSEMNFRKLMNIVYSFFFFSLQTAMDCLHVMPYKHVDQRDIDNHEG